MSPVGAKATEESNDMMGPKARAHGPQVPVSQPPLRQSSAWTHCLPFEHAAHEPPQSTSLSSPLFSPSLHVASLQVPPVHAWLSQSSCEEHVSPTLQGRH